MDEIQIQNRMAGIAGDWVYNPLMRALVRKVTTSHSPRSLAARVRHRGGLVLLESTLVDPARGRYSLVTVEPQLTLCSRGARCEVTGLHLSQVHYGNPWRILEAWVNRSDSPMDGALPWPAGGWFGYWGYELRQFVEPRLRPHPGADSTLPDCWLGFYDSVVVFDHLTASAWVVSTGQEPDGGRNRSRQRQRADFWAQELGTSPLFPGGDAWGLPPVFRGFGAVATEFAPAESLFADPLSDQAQEVTSELRYQAGVRAALDYIRQGDIYQVNLARRWRLADRDLWAAYEQLAIRSPAPFAAFIEGEDFALASASPELFLRMDGSHVTTRPIKGTRPRGANQTEDQALAHELLASAKEAAELTMITDLLRNDLGRVCEFGSVRVPELKRLEGFAQVQHLVSTVTGQLRPECGHLGALEACFPGGSVTGAPKVRAMQIIDELEPAGRGPYTGCLGYLGFNRRSQLSIIIRAAFREAHAVSVYGGAGIVADSQPESEHAEVLDKVRVLLEVLDSRRGGRAHLAAAAQGWAVGKQGMGDCGHGSLS